MIPQPERGRASRRDERATELITHEAAVFIAHESTQQSLITVTRTILSSRGEHATIFITVFPQKHSAAALSFLARLTGDFRGHLASKVKLHPLPKIEFVIDTGELHRQHLDEISKKLTRGPSGN